MKSNSPFTPGPTRPPLRAAYRLRAGWAAGRPAGPGRSRLAYGPRHSRLLTQVLEPAAAAGSTTVRAPAPRATAACTIRARPRPRRRRAQTRRGSGPGGDEPPRRGGDAGPQPDMLSIAWSTAPAPRRNSPDNAGRTRRRPGLAGPVTPARLTRCGCPGPIRNGSLHAIGLVGTTIDQVRQLRPVRRAGQDRNGSLLPTGLAETNDGQPTGPAVRRGAAGGWGPSRRRAPSARCTCSGTYGT